MTSPSAPDDRWIAEYYAPIRRTAWMLAGDPWVADDLTQETFLQAIDHWDQFENRSSELTWLYAILMRLDARRHRQFARARTKVRRWWNRKTVEPTWASDPAVRAARESWSESLWAEVAQLSVHHRQALVLHYAEEMEYRQMSQIMNCPEGTAKSRVHHAIRQLRSRLGHDVELHLPPREVVTQPNCARRLL